MAVLNHDQKNANIQARFDGCKAGVRVKRYLATVDGKKIGMVVMDDKGIDDARQSCIDRFGGRFHGIVEA